MKDMLRANPRVVIHPCAYRVPICGDVYVAKTGELKRCKAKNYSNRAKKRFIVFSFRETTHAQIVHNANEPWNCGEVAWEARKIEDVGVSK